MVGCSQFHIQLAQVGIVLVVGDIDLYLVVEDIVLAVADTVLAVEDTVLVVEDNQAPVGNLTNCYMKVVQPL